MAGRKQKKSPPQGTSALADRLHSSAIHLLRRVRKQDTATGEGPARLSALSVVVFGGPLTLGQLAAAEQVRPPTMTRIVAGLERDGLVKKKDDTPARRLPRISATPKGEKVLTAGRHRRVTLLATAIERLGVNELAEL